MIPINECLKILNADSEYEKYTEAEALELRDYLIELAEITHEAFNKENESNEQS